MPWITHPSVAGVVFVTQDQFTATWQPIGWVITDAPPGSTDVPTPLQMHFAGPWGPVTAYNTGDVIISPGGGVLAANAPLTTGADFSATGFTWLVPDNTGGITIGDTAPDSPMVNALWWSTNGSDETLQRWDVSAGWVLLASSGGGGGGGLDPNAQIVIRYDDTIGWPLKSTVTSNPNQPTKWESRNTSSGTPPAGGGYATPGRDSCLIIGP